MGTLALHEIPQAKAAVPRNREGETTTWMHSNTVHLFSAEAFMRKAIAETIWQAEF